MSTLLTKIAPDILLLLQLGRTIQDVVIRLGQEEITPEQFLEMKEELIQRTQDTTTGLELAIQDFWKRR